MGNKGSCYLLFFNIIKTVHLNLRAGIACAILIFGFSGSAYAGFTVLADAGTNHCEVKGISEQICSADAECSSSKKVCEIALNSLGGVIEGESIKLITKFVGQATVYASKTIVKFGTGKSQKKITNEIIGKLGQAFKFNSGIRKVKGFSPDTILEFSIDLVFSIAADLYVEQMTEFDMAEVRKLPISGFKSAPTKVIKTSLKRLIQIAKNNFKFLIFKTKNPVIAARSAIVDNSLILAEIGVDVANSSVEATDSILALSKSEKIGEILDLYIEHESPYFKAKNKIEKIRIKEEFSAKCSLIKLSGLETFWASLKKGKYSLATINSGLTAYCWKYELEMQKEDYGKYALIRLSTMWSKERYEKFIKYYFPDSEQYALTRLYEVENFDIDLKISNNHVSHKKIKSALAHGYSIDDILLGDTIFYQGNNIDKNNAHNLVLLGIWALELDDTHLLFQYDEYLDPDNNYNISRNEFSNIIINAYQLEDKLPIERINKLKEQAEIFAEAGKDWTYEALILLEFKIVNGSSNTFKSAELITKYEMLVMLVNVMDYIKCGYVTCDVANVIGAES